MARLPRIGGNNTDIVVCPRHMRSAPGIASRQKLCTFPPRTHHFKRRHGDGLVWVATCRRTLPEGEQPLTAQPRPFARRRGAPANPREVVHFLNSLRSSPAMSRPVLDSDTLFRGLSPPDGDAALGVRRASCPSVHRVAQDADLRLARILQAQEQAFLHLYGEPTAETRRA